MNPIADGIHPTRHGMNPTRHGMNLVWWTINSTSRAPRAAQGPSASPSPGYELFMVQVGREPSDFKPMPDIGPDDAIHVLHAFQKKTSRTSRMDIEIAKRRYRLIGAKR